jgi:hypothetical protein
LTKQDFDASEPENLLTRRTGYPSFMDKKEINSPKLTINFLIWICGVGGLLLAYLLAHFVLHVV